MSKKIKKRFIANAHCPSCRAIDTIVVYYKEEKMQSECVDCGYIYQPDSKKQEVAKSDIIFTSKS